MPVPTAMAASTGIATLSRAEASLHWPWALPLFLGYSPLAGGSTAHRRPDSRQLKKLPAVLFHSFPENPDAAFSILNHGINAFFSFGKQILNGNKKAIACVKSLPLQNLLLETDAPFQTLKGEKFTSPDEIKKVYEHAFHLRFFQDSTQEFSIFCQKLCQNFESLFG